MLYREFMWMRFEIALELLTSLPHQVAEMDISRSLAVEIKEQLTDQLQHVMQVIIILIV
jgi:hypothetical protein